MEDKQLTKLLERLEEINQSIKENNEHLISIKGQLTLVQKNQLGLNK